jgi:hypothetical protein
MRFLLLDFLRFSRPIPDFFEMFHTRAEGARGIDVLKEFLKKGGVFDPQAADEADSTQAMYAAQYAGIEGLKLFVENGGTFKPQAVNAMGVSEAMFIAKFAGAEGLQLFVDHDGKFNPDAKTDKGWTEAMFAAYFGKGEGIQIFADHGGRVNPKANGGAEGAVVIRHGGKQGLNIFHEQVYGSQRIEPWPVPS